MKDIHYEQHVTENISTTGTFYSGQGEGKRIIKCCVNLDRNQAAIYANIIKN